MDKKPELLAPAGNRDALAAAVENGADAVYLGAKAFSARQHAENFNDDELKHAMDYAHARDVKVFLTLNTLVSDSEMDAALELAGKAYTWGLDGIIVQDMGLAGHLKKMLPDIRLHASTQMTVYNQDGVRELEKLGFKRVVTARELCIDEIAAIARNTSIEAEVFIHGALCVCYSGQCLMSSIIGGRSGNRGKCAQPCRLRYELTDHHFHLKKNRKEFLLSPKDLCGLKLIPELLGAGVASFKIEGRMKTPEYVAAVTRIYRKYLDIALDTGEIKYVQPEDYLELMHAFNRGGFSYGYLKGKTGTDMMCFEKPKNWGTYLGEVLFYDSRYNRAGIKLYDTVSIGDGIEIWNGEDDSPGTVISALKIKDSMTDRAYAGQVAAINISGKIRPGCKVYKTSDKAMLERNRETYALPGHRKVYISGEMEIRKNKPAFIRVADSRGNRVETTGELRAENAVNRPLDKEKVLDQVLKTGGTPFEFNKFDCVVDENISLPLSELNACRRKALDALERKRTAVYERHYPYQDYIKGLHGGNAGCVPDGAGVGCIPDSAGAGCVPDGGSAGCGCIPGVKKEGVSLYYLEMPDAGELEYCPAKRVYLPFGGFLDSRHNFTHTCEKFRSAGTEVFCSIPPVTRGNLDDLLRMHIQDVCLLVDGFCPGNIGTLSILQESCGKALHADVSFNVFNRGSVHELVQLGISGVTLSHELTLKQVGEVVGNAGVRLRSTRTELRYGKGTRLGSNDGCCETDVCVGPVFECTVHGRIPLMVSEYCPVGCCYGSGSGTHCNESCGNSGGTSGRGDCRSGNGISCRGGCRKGGCSLKDRMGKEFPVICDRSDCRSTILNSVPFCLAGELDRFRGIGISLYRIYVYRGDARNAGRLAEIYDDILKKGIRVLDDMHKGFMNSVKREGFTRGHYFRGV